MKRWLSNLFNIAYFNLLLAAIILVSNATAQTLNKPSINVEDRYVTVDGRKMHYVTAGAGYATVVFESGLGNDLSAWNNLFTQVAGFAKVIAYDRAGYGSSEPATQPRSFTQIATELHNMLQQAHIPPPYILVGHSLGGAMIRAFTALYKNEVAGLVFIDPFNEYMKDGWTENDYKEAAAADSAYNDAPGYMKAELAMVVKEMEVNNFGELKSFGALPNVPVTLIVGGNSPASHWEDNQVHLYADKMRPLTEAHLLVIGNSMHYVHFYDPQLVTECIKRVVFPDATLALQQTLVSNSADSCLIKAKQMKAAYPDYLFAESSLNTMGYEALAAKDTKQAIALFALNTHFFPESSNVYDSLGEAYMDAGNKEEAIKNYERSLELNPANTNAVNMLKKLKSN